MMVMALARFTGWSLAELLDLTLEDLRCWYDVAEQAQKAEQ